MCGKFTAMASWSDAVDLSTTFSLTAGANGNDRAVAFRVMANLPIIVWDRAAGKRRVVPMRWGFPHPTDWRRPQPIHARAETINTTQAFAQSFHDGQRGIVLVKTFNEAPDIEGPTIQHTITPGDEPAIGIAMIWRRFEAENSTAHFSACCMVTVPANKLIAGLPTDRMPAVLAQDDWETWLGENIATADDVKACLKTVEGVRWTMTKEEREVKTSRRKPTPSNPLGLL